MSAQSQPEITLAPEAQSRPEEEISLVVTLDVGQASDLTLNMADPGLAASETLARRLLKIKGVRKLQASRISNRRGPVSAIRLRNR